MTYRIVVALALIGAAAPPAERVIADDALLPVTVNGQPGRLRIDPAAPGTPLIAAELADRARLKGGMVGFGYGVGPVRANHATAVARLDLGHGPLKRRVAWGTRRYATVADGTIGPTGLPEPVIRFQLRAPQPGERTTTLPMITEGGAVFGGFFALFAEITVGGEPMRVRFDPHHARTLATAGAALRLAAAQDGRLTGETVPTEIMFGIERPVRTLVLARPLQIGALSIATLGARTSDYGNATRIQGDGPPERVDPDEVVVTARGKKRKPLRDTLSLGADQLGHCSSLVFDKPARQIRLTCR